MNEMGVRKHVEEEGGRERKKERQKKRAPRPQTCPRWLGATPLHTYVHTIHKNTNTYTIEWVSTIRCSFIVFNLFVVCLFFFPSVCRLYIETHTHTHTQTGDWEEEEEEARCCLLQQPMAKTSNPSTTSTSFLLYDTHTHTHTHARTPFLSLPLLLYLLSLSSFRQNYFIFLRMIQKKAVP